jgi:NAD-dependent dihydropyrimidine dehydrogenase PreA subunit
MSQAIERMKPFLFGELCKGCGRCIEACPRDCIAPGSEIHPLTGSTPVHFDLARCSGCGLCVSACPEPYGIAEAPARRITS